MGKKKRKIVWRRDIGILEWQVECWGGSKDRWYWRFGGKSNGALWQSDGGGRGREKLGRRHEGGWDIGKLDRRLDRGGGNGTEGWS